MDDEIQRLCEACCSNPGDQHLLERFEEAFGPNARAILGTIAPRGLDLVRDAYQSAFVKFLEIFRSPYDPRRNYPAYLIAVAKNCLVDEIRRTRKYVQIDEVFEELLGSEASGADVLEGRIAVLQAIDGLSVRCRFLLQRYFVAGESDAEVGPLLGLRTNSVRNTRRRCLQRLREILDR